MSLILAVPIAFVICLIVVGILYLFGRKMAPPSRKKGEAVLTYACGEDMDQEKIQFRINWLYYAIYFVIFDIIAFTLSLSIQLGVFESALMAVAYSFISLVAILVLLRR
ncbi:MAG: NADH-quinone oxidoreductase subunit A [Promethearchaeota archaeon]